jgi:chitinase
MVDCEWFEDYGLGPAAAPENFCRSGCPNDRVRVAMDQYAQGCYVGGGGGGRSRCCVPSYSDTVKVENPKLDEYRDDMRAYLDDPTCENPGSVLDSRRMALRSIDIMSDQQNQNGTLVARGKSDAWNPANGFLLLLVTKSAASGMLDAMEEIWDDAMQKPFPNLKITNLRKFLTGLASYATDGPIQAVHDVICSPHYWNNLAGPRTLTCGRSICEEESCDDLDRRSLPEKRIVGQRAPYYSTLTGNGGTVTISTTLPAVSTDSRCPPPWSGGYPTYYWVELTRVQYQGVADIDDADPLNDEAVDFTDEDDCGNTRVTHVSLPSEHLLSE